MSIFGSMTTAVLGLSAQSKALGHISDNIANASTNGYKRVNTAFETLVLQSNQRLHEPGGVTAAPVFMNNIQGNLTQVQSATNAAIQGQGFFSVSKLSRGLTGPGQQGETVQTQTGTLNADNVYYTRVGDFELDKNRYLVNSAGFALNGWGVDDTTGQLKKDVVQPLQVNTLTDKPQPTNNITLGANLPATPTPGVPIPSSSIQVYDTQGNARTIQFNWRQDSSNVWRLGIDAPGSVTKPVDGTITGSPATMSAGVKTAGQTAVAQESKVLLNGTTSSYPSTVTLNGQTNFYPDGTSQDNIRVGDVYSLTIKGPTPITVSIGPLTVGGANDIANYPDYKSIANALKAAVPSPFKASIPDPKDPRTIQITTAEGYPVDVTASFTNATPVQSTIVSGPTTNLTGSASGTQQSYYNFSAANIDVGDEFRVTVGTKTFSVRVTQNSDDLGAVTTGTSSISIANAANINAVVARLVTVINNAPGYSGLAANGATALKAPAPGVPFGGTANQLVLGNAAFPTFTTSASQTDASSTPNTMKAATPTADTTYTPTTTTPLGVQNSTIDFGSTTALKVPDVYSLSIGGNTYRVPVSYQTINSLTTAGNGNGIDGVIAELVKKINLDTANNGFTAAAGASGQIKLVAVAAAPVVTTSGERFNITATDNVRVGEKYSVTVDNVSYAVEVTDDNVTTMGTFGGVANALAAKINSARPQAPVIATVVNSELKLTARTAGTPFQVDQEYTAASSTTNQVTGPTVSAPTTSRGEQQDFTFPQTKIDIGDRYTVSIDGYPVSVQVNATNYSSFKDMSGVVQELANSINRTTGLNVIATATGGRLSITHNTPSTGRFVATAHVDDASSVTNSLITSTTTSNVPGIHQQQQVTLVGSPGDVGAEYSVTINGTPISYKTTGTETSMEDITTQLANTINKTSQYVTASAIGSVLTVVAKNAKTSNGTNDNGEFDLKVGATDGKTPSHVKLTFGTDADNVGTITGISTSNVGTKGTAVTSVNTQTGANADITFTVDYGFGPQQITLNVGKFGKSGGVTQFAGNEINVRELVQDGASRGQYKEVVYGDNGDVIVNYDNGRSRVIGRIPVVTFNNPNALQREAGGVYIETDEGGRPNFNDPDTNGAGAVVANSVEASNVDIADEFTKLIVTQRTYSANTKIVTTSDEMLQEVLGLKR
ncbi:flagellar hook-basal body complex protein [Azospirillum canadense]|uniref:flagellar hook-basal body complex protein n=1 Tax=Azospirillum canadense TaxID=403962 RepID=UPI002226401A|nr:flagellar hook-basal body complex protein [Azospirillum canadense]MCW2243909.1 flagellar hook protein FlgE [Azospirillum canadense]